MQRQYKDLNKNTNILFGKDTNPPEIKLIQRQVTFLLSKIKECLYYMHFTGFTESHIRLRF